MKIIVAYSPKTSACQSEAMLSKTSESPALLCAFCHVHIKQSKPGLSPHIDGTTILFIAIYCVRDFKECCIGIKPNNLFSSKKI